MSLSFPYRFVRQDAVTVKPKRHVVRAVAGNAVELHCQATGSPTPRLSWKRTGHGSALRHWRATGEKLKIGNVSLSDNGTYICTASNSFSTASAQITLKVQGEETIAALQITIFFSAWSLGIPRFPGAAEFFQEGWPWNKRLRHHYRAKT